MRKASTSALLAPLLAARLCEQLGAASEERRLNVARCLRNLAFAAKPAEDGDSDEEEKIVGADLDEIGISFGDTIPDAPDAMAARPQQAPVAVADAVGGGGGGGPPPPPSGGDTTVSDLEARLNNLRK